MTSQRIRGLLAVLALAALIGGVPWLLWTFTGGAPWESVGKPSEWLSSELDSSAIMSILTVVLWAAWAYFVVCVAVEAVRARRDRPAPAGGLGAQPLARRLVASALLLLGTTAVTAPAATASTVAAGGGSETTSISARFAGLNGQVDDVRAAASMSSQASSALAGGSSSVREAAGPATATQGLATFVHPPRGQNYDCLWDIAERTLGDGTRWTEIYQLNKGVMQDDGNRLVDPDLIYPGWRMKLPDDARGPNVVHLTPDGQVDPTRGTTNDRSANNAATDGVEGNQSSTGAGLESDASVSSPFIPADHSTLYAQMGLGGGLIAAGLLWGLRRKRGWNGGDPPGRGSRFEEEQRLMLRADRPSAAFADRAMRAIRQQDTSGGGGPAARPSTARLSGDRLSVRFDAVPGPPPVGWTAGTDQYEWVVQPSALREDQPHGPSAAPQLVCIGVDGRDQVLLNLAASGGVVAVSGDQRVASEMARSMVIDLATHAWADVIEVLAVGFHEDLLPLGGGRIRQFETVEDAVAHVRGTVQHRLTERVIVSMAEPSRTEEASLVGLATDRTKPVGVFVCGDIERAALRLSVNADGLVVPAGWNLALQAQRMSAASIPPLVALYGQEPEQLDPTGPAPVPGFDPRLADLAAGAVADVRLLGPLSVQAAGKVDTERQPQAAELVTCLALHPDGVHTRVLEGMLWPRGATDDVVDAAIEHARRWLTGPDGGEAMEQREGRWFLDLSRVRVDWHVLQMCRVDGAHAGAEMLDALRLVRGAPLSELAAQRYTWVQPEMTRRINETIVEAAEAAATDATKARRTADADEALRLGLRGVPDAEVLWRRLLRLTAAEDGSEAVARVADEMFETLARWGSPRGPEGSTLALVEDLLPNHPRPGSQLTA